MKLRSGNEKGSHEMAPPAFPYTHLADPTVGFGRGSHLT
jgi:hypothetical protein